MQRSDIRAVGKLAGEASTVPTTRVRGMHAGIAGRVFASSEQTWKRASTSRRGR